MVDRNVSISVQQYLLELKRQGLPVSFAVVFGSQARGNAGEWSDIDLMVVSPVFDTKSGLNSINLLWRVAARMDSRIEPIPCGERQWVEDNSSAVIETARREGEHIQPAA